MGSLPEVEIIEYPYARRDNTVVDNYHGVQIEDPYRWLEDPDSKEVNEFVEKQRNLTQDYLNTCYFRERFRDRITALLDYPKYECPFKRGNKYFYFHNTGLQAQSVLYELDDLEGEAYILLDPNKLSEDGTVSLAAYSFSEDAKYLAFGLSSSGSDWVTIKVMQIQNKSMELDTLSWVKFSSITWTHDNKGFFYSRYPPPKKTDSIDVGTETDINLYHQLYYHFLGTDQSEDILCWKDCANPKWTFISQITEDGKYLLMMIEEGCDPVNRLYYCDLSALLDGLQAFKHNNHLLPFVKLVDNFEAYYGFVANDGTIFTFRTNKNASRYKIVRTDLNDSNHGFIDVIPESETNVLEWARCVNRDKLLVCYLNDVKNKLEIRDLGTGDFLHRLPLDIGSVHSISARCKDEEIFVGFSSFLTPGIIYRCNLNVPIPKLVVFRESTPKDFDRTKFETKQVFVRSKDGTRIPVFIVSRKGIKLNKENPVLLYGYGGFGISLSPFFSVPRLIFAHHCSGVFAFANIRGGGEYGEDWHKAGSLGNKQNCFDDFISCAEYLIEEGYTQPNKLAIEGGSNGGLLVGACINQRPDLFGCAISQVGVMDMLRFHKFTIGHAWTTEYGCADNELDFHWLIKYSPLHNVRWPWDGGLDGTKDIKYPAILLLTADHDDRVVPLHSLKFLATLQYTLCTSVANSRQTNPILARIETNAGHGGGRPTQKMIDEATDKYAFISKVIHVSWLD